MSKITHCISSFNNLNYLKLAVKSVRENSYYKDSPEEPNFRSQPSYYSFVYWYQPNKDVKSFE